MTPGRPTSKLTPKQVGIKYGFRSGLEERVAVQLKVAKVPFEYEKTTLKYIVPARTARYTPDFVILPNGIIVETKGRFLTDDRQKMLLIKEQYPDLDIRFVFTNPNTRISKTSATTYAMWADKHGFPYAKGTIPSAWLKEKPTKVRMEALNKVKHGS